MNLNFTEPGRSVENLSGFFQRYPSIVFAMRVSVFYLALLTGSIQMLPASSGNGQTLAEIEVTLGMRRGENLESLFKNIEKQSGLLFAYDYGKVNQYNNIRLVKAKRTIKETLDIVLKETPFIYHQIKNSVIIFKEGEEKYRGDESIPINEEQETVNPLPVTGKVTDVKGTPMAGVNIVIKGTASGTTTDADGLYVIDAKDDDILIFSFIGYKSIETQVGGRSTIDLTMELDIATLEEVVVNAGYWQVKEREQTGNISKVTTDEISRQPVGNPLASLQGRVPGLQITQQNGIPGGGFTVRIRGRNSVRDEGNEPLYIIDGVPFFSNSLTSANQSVASSYILANGISPLNVINLSDIESVEILKDADATAIYGSRGANGVILITTKRGHARKTKFDINIHRGIGQVTQKMKLLSAKEYLEMRKEAFVNDGVEPNEINAPDLVLWDTTRFTDWQQELIGGTAQITNAHASISGGSNTVQYLLGTGYRKETTVFPGDDADEKISVNLNLNSVSENQKFRNMLSVNYSTNNTNLLNNDLTSIALSLPPIAPSLFKEDGHLNWENSTWTNPLSYLKTSYEANTNNLISNALLSYELLAGLQIKSSLGFTNNTTSTTMKIPRSSVDPANASTVESQSTFTSASFQTWILEPQVNWKKSIGSGALDVLIGATFQDQKNKTEVLSALGFSSEALMEDINSADEVDVAANSVSQYRYAAVYGRINFNFKQKYIVNLTGRRDGSSRFGPGKQFGNFGAVGLAWIFSNEDFIQNNIPFLSFGKLRGSFGITGNDQIGDYQFLSTYTSGTSYSDHASLIPTRLFNSNFGWETNRKTEVALNLGLLNDRVFIETAYYRNRSSNQLVGIPLPPNTGYLNVTANLPAIVENYGAEFVLTTINTQTQNLSWNTIVNFTIPRNKLIEYPGLDGSPYAGRYEIGEPLNIIKSYNYLGVDSETGVYTFEDVNEDGIISTPDKQVVMDLSQKFYGGFQNNFRYKGFELNFLFQFIRHNGRNIVSIFGSNPGTIANLPNSFMNRWQKPGDVADIQKFSQNFSVAGDGDRARQSNLAISDASFIRLKNISLIYQLPKEWYRLADIEEIKVFILGQNLFTLSNFNGLDPEVTGQALPPLRMFTIGINLLF